jgi:hypothetical protein
MVTGGGHRGFDPLKDRAAIVLDRARFPVHQLPGPYHFSAERFAQGLMSEADSKHRNLAGEVTKQFDADPRFMRSAWPWGDHDAVGVESLDLVNAQLVVAANVDFGAQFAEILHQVVGERVVVVENEDHRNFSGY